MNSMLGNHWKLFNLQGCINSALTHTVWYEKEVLHCVKSNRTYLDNAKNQNYKLNKFGNIQTYSCSFGEQNWTPNSIRSQSPCFWYVKNEHVHVRNR